jgi:ATPase family associated with various cellular activities (AAA)
MPAQYWPNLLNNNHWHDVVKFIQTCFKEPGKIHELIRQPRRERFLDASINRLIFRWHPDGQRTAFHANYTMVKKLVEKAMDYRDQMALEEQITHLVHALEQHGQIVLMGPPGTSKTYLAKRLAARLLSIDVVEVEKEEAGQESAFVHACFRGIQITTPPDGSAQPVYQTAHRLFGELAKTAAIAWNAWKNSFPNSPPLLPDTQCPKFVCIIDEINRAHLAAVLGELIYGLEYRGSAVSTPYAVDADRSS